LNLDGASANKRIMAEMADINVTHDSMGTMKMAGNG
jgi:hypothetical protein